MLTHSRRVHTVDALREYVNDHLCQFEQLEPGAFAMTERILVRSGRPCGMYFCLHGPRAVKFTAVWETDRNTIFFYRASGERHHQVRLACGPKLCPATQAATS
jgi:hypothetical protein